MEKGGMSERAGGMWTALREAKEKHGEESAEYNRALTKWIKFLRNEAFATKKRAEDNMEDLRRAYREAREARERHGHLSSEFDAAEKKFFEARDRVNRAIEDIEPIFRAAMSL